MFEQIKTLHIAKEILKQERDRRREGERERGESEMTGNG